VAGRRRRVRGHEDNELLAPLLPFVELRRFDPRAEARGTPVEGASELWRSLTFAGRPNFFRFVVLHNHGGTHVDADTMFLRDMEELLDSLAPREEYCYRWSAMPRATSAVMRLEQGSETAEALLLKCRERGSCRPRHMMAFEDIRDVDLLVLPCVFFDPLWLHRDSVDRYRAAPFNVFGDFFRPFGWRFRRRPGIGSHRDLFPGAFAYQWHNHWNDPEYEKSYCGLCNREFDRLLADRLGIGAELVAPGLPVSAA
jgi:hypothetical protein